jgi:hypothetical protein
MQMRISIMLATITLTWNLLGRLSSHIWIVRRKPAEVGYADGGPGRQTKGSVPASVGT